MSWQEWDEMFCNADRTYARTTATMRRSKCLVQVQVANVGANKAGICQTYLRIHVGAVHIYLCSAFMDDAADFYDFCFKNTVSRRIGNHQCGKVVFVFFRLGTKIIHVHITLCVASTSHSSKTGLDGRCRIGAMG